jgi:hypothetical protein
MRISPDEGHDVAQVCMNGHRVNSYSRTVSKYNSKFCTECGIAVIDSCQQCGGLIRGGSLGRVVGRFKVPAYCQHCGKPFPWTDAALTAAKEYADELDLNADEKEQLKSSIDDLTSDTARTPLAASRFKRFMSKATPEAGKALLQIVVSVATEEAKKKLFGL